MVDGYELISGPPSVDEYLRLRREAGLSEKTDSQAAAGIGGAWAAVHVRTTTDRLAVGMGRVIGDGGWYFHIIDMAVLPAHQRQGIGNAILTALLHEIADRAPAGAFVSLLADPPGRRLYERHGFVPTAPRWPGMRLAP